MNDRLKQLEDPIYSVMRAVTGFLFLWHGGQKLFGWFGEMPPDVGWHIVYVAGGIEFFGGILVMVGLLTRPTAFLCSGLMAFAYWIGHGTGAVLPKQNGGEMAALYCFVFLFIAAYGPGRWSLDTAIRRR